MRAQESERLRSELQRKLHLYHEALLDVRCESEALQEELERDAAAEGAVVTVLRRRGDGGADVLCRLTEGPKVELRVAVIGNVRCKARLR